MRKLFDIHAHVGEQQNNLFQESNLFPRKQELEALIDQYKERIDKIITFPMPGTVYFNYENAQHKPSGLSRHPFELENQALIEAVDSFSGGDRIIPFACIHPKEMVSEQLDHLSGLMRDKRLCGIKLHTLDTLSSIEDFFSNEEIINFCRQHEMPIMIHSANFNGVENCNGIFNWAEKYPDLNICIAHLMNFSKKFFEGLSGYKRGNLFTDTSPFLALCEYLHSTRDGNDTLDLSYESPLQVLQALYDRYDKFLVWGSDEPFGSFEIGDGKSISYSLEDELQFLMSINESVRNKIASINSKRFLGQKSW